MSIAEATEVVRFEFWQNQKLSSTPETPIAIDTETRAIDDEREIPELALAAASDGNLTFLIHPDRLGDFLNSHRDEHFVAHNVAFDYWVMLLHLERADHVAIEVLPKAADSGRLHDSMLLDMLVQIATGIYRGPGQEILVPANLGILTAEYLEQTIDKNDPYRMRFGELIGLSDEEILNGDQGFLEYAAADVEVLYQLYPQLVDRAGNLLLSYGYHTSPEHNHSDIRTASLSDYGLLTETLQVQASIVLAEMFRKGVNVDQGMAHQLTQQYEQRLNDVATKLDELAPQLFRRDREGNIKRTAVSGAPSMSTAVLKDRLEEAAGSCDQPFPPPQSDGKTGGISTSTKLWEPYRDRSPFIGHWIGLKQTEKLLSFLRKIESSSILHCRYNPLIMTGRTTCSKPRSPDIPGLNLQQIPHTEEFRSLFVPRNPGDRLLIADYSAVELRTLAAICEERFGQSRLADVLREGRDPHAFTAAMIVGQNYDDFLSLRDTDSENFRFWRQAAKAVNFGVPGGLGSRGLAEYAKNTYGVEMSENEANTFRQRLITEVYPELNDQNGYLLDRSFEALAQNLGTDQFTLLQWLEMTGESARFVGGIPNVVRGRSTTAEFFQDRVWEGLERAVQANRQLPEAIRQRIRLRRGSEELHRWLYFQQVASPTGRIRGGVKYTNAKNTPFQALAADGAKLALWRLFREGFDVWGFIHDEFVINLTPDQTEEDEQRAVQIMRDAMSEVLGVLPAECEWAVADHWAKP